MVAVKAPNLTESFAVLCEFLRKNAKLTVHVVNHIATKHGIHSLPAFHTSELIAEAEKLATYSELARALIANAKGDGAALGRLQGQVANGQAKAKDEPKPESVVERTPDKQTPTADPKPRVEIPEPKPDLLKGRDAVLPEVNGNSKPKTPNPKPQRIADPLTDRLRELLVELIGEMPATLDESKVREIANSLDDERAGVLRQELDEHKDALASNVTALFDKAMTEAKPTAGIQRIEIKLGDAIRPIEGAAHRQLPQVATWLAAGVPVWLWGPAGGGKTHLARQIAGVLGLKFHSAAIDETITVGKLVGFRNVANGEFVEGLIYRSYKEGGVQLLDEIDTNATAIASLNSLLANDYYTFPNGEEVRRHPDFRVLAGANTKGTGAVAGYTARVRLDAATLDRFAVIQLEYDAGLELALAAGLPNSSQPWKPGKPATREKCERYVQWVQKARAAVGTSVLISPRASYLGVRALQAGVPVAEVAEALVFKLAAADTRQRILNEAGDVFVAGELA